MYGVAAACTAQMNPNGQRRMRGAKGCATFLVVFFGDVGVLTQHVAPFPRLLLYYKGRGEVGAGWAVGGQLERVRD